VAFQGEGRPPSAISPSYHLLQNLSPTNNNLIFLLLLSLEPTVNSEKYTINWKNLLFKKIILMMVRMILNESGLGSR
jgi:hypothetical protein